MRNIVRGFIGFCVAAMLFVAQGAQAVPIRFREMIQLRLGYQKDYRVWVHNASRVATMGGSNSSNTPGLSEPLAHPSDPRAAMGADLIMLVNADNPSDTSVVQFGSRVRVVQLAGGTDGAYTITPYYNEPSIGRIWFARNLTRWEAGRYGEVIVASQENPVTKDASSVFTIKTTKGNPNQTGGVNPGDWFALSTTFRGWPENVWFGTHNSRFPGQREALIGPWSNQIPNAQAYGDKGLDARNNDNCMLVANFAARTNDNASTFNAIAAKLFDGSISLPALSGAYTFWLPFSGSKVFKAQIPNDLHVLLSRAQGDAKNGFEFVLGGWGNSRSVIRKGSQGGELVANNSKIANNSQMNTYWVSANPSTKVLSLGAGAVIGQNVLIQVTTGEDVSNLAWISFSTWDQSGVYGPAVDMTKAAADAAAAAAAKAVADKAAADKAAADRAALEKVMLAQAGTSAISIPATKIGGGGFIFSEQWKAKPADGYVITCQARGLNDLCFILATKPDKMAYRPFTGHGMAGESYEAFFGAWGNRRNLLLKNGQYVRQGFVYPKDNEADAKVNDIITKEGLITGGRDLGDGTAWDWYWVKYLHGRLSMGKGQNPDDAKSEIMAWQDPAPLMFKDGVYVGFGTYNTADIEIKDIKIATLEWKAPQDYEAALDVTTKQVVWAKEFTVGSRGGQFWAFYVDPMTENAIYQYQIGSMSDNPWTLWLKDPKDEKGAAVGKLDSVVVTSDGAMAILSQAGIVYTVDADKKALTALPMVDDKGAKIEQAEQIAYGNSKNLWLFDDKTDAVYQYDFAKNAWVARCPQGAAAQIAVGLDGETWALASDGTPARYAGLDVDGNAKWERKPGQKLDFIAVGSQGAIFGVFQGTLYAYKDGKFVADPTVTGIRQVATNATGKSMIINTIDFMLGVKGKTGVAIAAPTTPSASVGSGIGGLADILVKSGGKKLDAATQAVFQKGLTDLFANVQKESADSKAAYAAFLKTYADNTIFDATTQALMKKQLADAVLAPAVAAVAKAAAPTTPPPSAEEKKAVADAAQKAVEAAKAQVAAATTPEAKAKAIAEQTAAAKKLATAKAPAVKVAATAAPKATKAAVSLGKAKTTAAAAAKTDPKAAAAAKTAATAKTTVATKAAAKVEKKQTKATTAAKATTKTAAKAVENPYTKAATTTKAAKTTAKPAATAKTAAKTPAAKTPAAKTPAKATATTAKAAAKTSAKAAAKTPAKAAAKQ